MHSEVLHIHKRRLIIVSLYVFLVNLMEILVNGSLDM